MILEEESILQCKSSFLSLLVFQKMLRPVHASVEKQTGLGRQMRRKHKFLSEKFMHSENEF